MLFSSKTIPTQRLFIPYKIAHSCSFGLRGNLDFRDFLQKSFITLTTDVMAMASS